VEILLPTLPHVFKPQNIKINMKKTRKSSQQIKSKARRNLNRKIDKKRKKYVVDTSVIINKFIPRLIERGLKGQIIIPNAVIAELENLANKGIEAGFIGLEQVASLHKIKKKKISLVFAGQRPDMKQIKYAKSGEIDALIRGLAFKNKAILVTADLVQAKSAQAYGIKVVFLKPRYIKKKKRWFSFFKKY